MYPKFCNEQKNIHHYILEQIKTAFTTEPNIAATIHGQRKIFQGCYRRRTALFPSKKCGGSIPTESRLELAHAVCLERDPNVVNYRSQALKIKLSHEQHCYPDLLISFLSPFKVSTLYSSAIFKMPSKLVVEDALSWRNNS